MGMNFVREIEILIRARYPILYLVTSEELRVQTLLLEIAQTREKKIYEWSSTSGILAAGASIQVARQKNTPTKDPLLALDQVVELLFGPLYHRWLLRNGPLTDDYADGIADLTVAAITPART